VLVLQPIHTTSKNTDPHAPKLGEQLKLCGRRYTSISKSHTSLPTSTRRASTSTSNVDAPLWIGTLLSSETARFPLASCLTYSSIPKMVAVCFSETSASLRTVRCYNPADRTLQSDRRENLMPKIIRHYIVSIASLNNQLRNVGVYGEHCK
jgi:hypothetical protein